MLTALKPLNRVEDDGHVLSLGIVAVNTVTMVQCEPIVATVCRR